MNTVLTIMIIIRTQNSIGNYLGPYSIGPEDLGQHVGECTAKVLAVLSVHIYAETCMRDSDFVLLLLCYNISERAFRVKGQHI